MERMSSCHSLLKRFTLFESLSDTLLADIGRMTYRRAFPRRSHIFIEGEEQTGVYFIIEGLVKVYKMDQQGSEHIISILQKGDMFPHIGLLQPERYPGTAQTLEDTQVLWMKLDTFQTLISTHPEIFLRLFSVLERKIMDLQSQLSAALSGEVLRKLIAILVHLSKMKPVYDTQTPLTLTLTHQDLAYMIGSTRESVNRALNELKKEGLIDYRRGEVVLLNLSALKQKLETD